MAAALLNQFKQRIEILQLEPSDGGCFELTVNGQLLYSKLKTGQFPEEAKILTALEN